MFKSFRRPKKRALIAAFLLLLIVPCFYIWISAPADPIYNGKRLSTLLYQTYGGPPGLGIFGGRPVTVQQECHDALKHLGPKAAPLLTAWIENRPSPMRDKLRDFLRKKQIDWPYLTADHQDIVERLFFQVPSAAVPLSEAFQWQILNGPERDATKAAVLLMFVMNSVDAASRELIASRSVTFAIRLLDKFESTGQDSYALAIVGPILKNSPDNITPELKERVLNLSKRSRYLDSAATFLKPAKAVEPK